MSSGKSIDGLRRRSASTQKPLPPKRTRLVKKVSVSNRTQKNIGVSGKEKATDAIGVVSTRREKRIREADNTDAV